MVKFVKSIPGDKHRRYDWDSITTQLRERPNMWGIIEDGGEKASSIAAAQTTSRKIRNGWIKGINPGEFESVTRGNTVYAKYVGTGDNNGG